MSSLGGTPAEWVGLSPEGGCSAEMLRQFDVRRLVEEDPTRAILLLNPTDSAGIVDSAVLASEEEKDQEIVRL